MSFISFATDRKPRTTKMKGTANSKSVSYRLTPEELNIVRSLPPDRDASGQLLSHRGGKNHYA